MKSKIYNNVDGAKDCGTYMELPLLRFLMQMPQYAPLIAATVPHIDLNDKNYIVRFVLQNNKPPLIEVGYPEDAEWRIGQPDNSKQISYPVKLDELDKMLDKELAEGKEFLVMPIADFLQIYPNYEEIFTASGKADTICAFRTSDNITRTLVGSSDYTTEKWKQIIETNFCHE